jgi:hypothetical protein
MKMPKIARTIQTDVPTNAHTKGCCAVGNGPYRRSKPMKVMVHRTRSRKMPRLTDWRSYSHPRGSTRLKDIFFRRALWIARETGLGNRGHASPSSGSPAIPNKRLTTTIIIFYVPTHVVPVANLHSRVVVKFMTDAVMLPATREIKSQVPWATQHVGKLKGMAGLDIDRKSSMQTSKSMWCIIYMQAHMTASVRRMNAATTRLL